MKLEIGTFALSLVFGTIAGMANLLGGIFVAFGRRLKESQMKCFIAFGSGFILATAMMKMIPKSVGEGSSEIAPILLILGYLFVYFCENVLVHHIHLEDETHRHDMIGSFVGLAALIGMIIHSLFDGIVIASGFAITTELGVVFFLATVFHKVPEGITIASIMLASGKDRKYALCSAGALALATIFGAALVSFLGSSEQYVLPLATGVMIYVVASDLIPVISEVKGIKIVIIVCLGVVIFWGTDTLLGLVGLE